METIVTHPRSSVFYDKNRDIFIKKFTPKISSRIKYFFRLRKYPGENFYYISTFLNSLNIKTPTVVKHLNYSVETKNIKGISLEEFIKNNPTDKDIINKFTTLVITLIDNSIYCGDLSLDNFMVKDNEIYVLDLEDYRHVKFFKHNKDEFLRRLKGKVPREIFENIIEKL
ncbi:Mn2+dependent serine/threonine protein kinase [Cetobacterium somerae]|uniref:Mn2+dependent serine/threonine protein kinase n=1 Tax=Cetobacterium sp. NK01 TaxID=2993530 RepID=UPI0021161529|nr:Mn2+dependent serine/threonine protein kinase [Cetobacterium sp. NK01]MCQ8212092.1 Mn2+dependent serine/threonine protein kinase [Cetobacterium sp. NK01]